AVGSIVLGVTHTGSFVGHVGGDDFVAFVDCHDARQQMEAAQRKLRMELREILPEGAGDRDTYRGVDREGVERDFPLTRLTAAIINIDPEGMESMFDLSEMVAEAKRISKRAGGDGLAELSYAPQGRGAATARR